MKPRWKLRPFLIAELLLAALAGCLRPTEPVVYHTLQAQAARSERPPPGQGLAVEVMPVGLPDMLRRPQIVTALGPGSLELSRGHRWGNPLQQEIQRVVVEDLSRALGSDRIVAFPYGVRVNATFRVEVDVLHCEGRPGGTLTFLATWMITRPGAEMAVVLGRTACEEPVPGTDAGSLVAAHSQALARLSQEIAIRLRDPPPAHRPVQALPAPIRP